MFYSGDTKLPKIELSTVDDFSYVDYMKGIKLFDTETFKFTKPLTEGIISERERNTICL